MLGSNPAEWYNYSINIYTKGSETITMARDIADDTKFDKIYWHGAFYEALQLEFNDYLDILDFTNEYALGKEALKMDALVIRKNSSRQVDKNIGKIFKGYNIFEFKSEKDTLTWRDYNKVIAYAYLYSSFNGVQIRDITITFAVTIHPRTLIKYLQEERAIEVKEIDDGIYTVADKTFDVQILESKKLPRDQNLFLRNLRSKLPLQDAHETITKYQSIKTIETKNVYLDRLLKANIKIFREVMKMTDSLADTIRYIMQDSKRWKEMIELEAQVIAKEKAENWAKDMAEDMAYDIAQDMAQDMAQDIAQDMAHGIAEDMAQNMITQKMLDIAKRLLQTGLAIEDVAKNTELPPHIVASLVSA